MSHFPWNSKYDIKCSHVVRSRLKEQDVRSMLKEQDGGEASLLPANIKAFLLQLLTIAWLRDDQGKKNWLDFGHCPKNCVEPLNIFLGPFSVPEKCIFLRICTKIFIIAHIRMLGYTWFQNNKKRITDIICACGFSKYFLKTVIRFLQQMENVKSSDSWLHGKADQSVISKVLLQQLTIIAWLDAVLFSLSQKSIPGLGKTPILSHIH